MKTEIVTSNNLNCELWADHHRTNRRVAANSTKKKLAVQWLNEALCFYQSLCLVDSFVLLNHHLQLLNVLRNSPANSMVLRNARYAKLSDCSNMAETDCKKWGKFPEGFDDIEKLENSGGMSVSIERDHVFLNLLVAIKLIFIRL